MIQWINKNYKWINKNYKFIWAFNFMMLFLDYEIHGTVYHWLHHKTLAEQYLEETGQIPYQSEDPQ